MGFSWLGPAMIRSGMVIMVIPFLSERLGWHHTWRDDGQDSHGALRQAPSRSSRPVGVRWVSELGRRIIIKTARKGRHPEVSGQAKLGHPRLR